MDDFSKMMVGAVAKVNATAPFNY